MKGFPGERRLPSGVLFRVQWVKSSLFALVLVVSARLLIGKPADLKVGVKRDCWWRKET